MGSLAQRSSVSPPLVSSSNQLTFSPSLLFLTQPIQSAFYNEACFPPLFCGSCIFEPTGFIWRHQKLLPGNHEAKGEQASEHRRRKTIIWRWRKLFKLWTKPPVRGWSVFGVLATWLHIFHRQRGGRLLLVKWDECSVVGHPC